MGGQREITMTMWMKKDENRTIFQALSPVNLEYERMPNQPYKVDRPTSIYLCGSPEKERHGTILSSAYMNQVLIRSQAI